jgi:hypothetical protein
MPSLHVVADDEVLLAKTSTRAFPVNLIVQWCVGIFAAFVLGTWLVWWSAVVQRTFTTEDIRSACQRVMPESVERCIDTVTIQRGGARR